MTSINETLSCLDASDWVTIVNIAIQAGGLDSLTINRETLAKWRDTPDFKPQLQITHDPIGGLVFTPIRQVSALPTHSTLQ